MRENSMDNEIGRFEIKDRRAWQVSNKDAGNEES